METWWIRNEQAMNFRSEHDWTIDGSVSSTQIFVGTHSGPSTTHVDDSGVLDSDETYDQYYDVRDPIWRSWTKRRMWREREREREM